MNSRVETHNPSDDNCNISEHHLVMALGVFLVYMFPLLGNAIIYPWCDIGRTYRRIAQISLLLTGVWIVWFYGIQPHVSSFLRKFFFIGAHKTFVFSLLVITCLGIINSVKGTQVPMVFMLAKFLIAGFWVSIGPILWCNPAMYKTSWAASVKSELSKAKFSEGFLIAIICLCIAMKAWAIPPTISRGYNLDLCGSTTIVGVCSVIAYFTILFSVKFKYAFVAALPCAYLFVYSAARQTWLIFLFLTCVFAIFEFRRGSGRFLTKLWRSFVVILLVGILMPVIILGPAAFANQYYPYLRTQSSPQDACEFQRCLVGRYGRFLMILPETLRNMVLECCENKVTSSHLDSDQQKLLSDFTASRTSGDERLLIWSDALKAISKQALLGQWPTTPLLEGRDNMTYMHPHNFTLEMAIYFGWPLACVATLNILCLFFVSLWHLTRTVSFVDQFISIAIIGEFLRMQFSGDLLDTYSFALFESID